jgi:hypothetical protein
MDTGRFKLSTFFILFIAMSASLISSVLSSYGNTANIVNAKEYSNYFGQAASLTSIESQTDFRISADADDDIGIGVVDQITITPQADHSNNNACTNRPSQDRGMVPPFCVGHLVVVNDNGGTNTAVDFTIDVSRPFSGAESPGTDIALTPGSFRVGETGPPGYSQTLSGDCSGTINAGDNKVCTITNNDNPQTAGPSITVSNVQCIGTSTQQRIHIDVTVSGISHDSQPLTFQEQVFSPTGYLVRLHEYTIPANAPDPATTFIGEGIDLPLGPTAGTYKITDIINGQAVSTTFQVPECSQQ